MIGNAIPPKFTYFLAAAMKGTEADKIKLPKKVSVKIEKISIPFMELKFMYSL